MNFRQNMGRVYPDRIGIVNRKISVLAGGLFFGQET